MNSCAPEVQALYPRDGHMVPAVLRRVIVKVRIAKKRNENNGNTSSNKIKKVKSIYGLGLW